MVEGKRIEPPVSEPSEAKQRPAAVADAGARRGRAGPVGRVPGIERRGNVGMVRAVGALGHLQLAQDHRARLLAAARRRWRPSVGTLPRWIAMPAAVGDARGVAEILHRDRHAMQRPARRAGGGLGVEARGIGQRAVGGHGRIALESGIELADAVEHRPGQLRPTRACAPSGAARPRRATDSADRLACGLPSQRLVHDLDMLAAIVALLKRPPAQSRVKRRGRCS